MKKLLFVFLLFGNVLNVLAQDKIVLRDGTELNVKVLESKENVVVFTYPNEDIKNEKPKSMIDYILYASGRREEGMKIPTIESKDDWEKVILTTDKNAVIGLNKIKYLSVSGGSLWVTRETAHKSAEEKIRKKAAKIGCGIVLVTEDKYTGKSNEFCHISGECYK
ncbi:MAG: hypothetical protein IJ185_03690 [Prevotella sp.]|nr:hypothetical protein [Prevotella sp.]